jgi:hypothetical protein
MSRTTPSEPTAPTRASRSRVPAREATWVVGGAAVVTAVAWLDAAFLPLVLLGPLVSGAVAAWRGGRRPAVAACWFLAGLGMLVTDWVVNNEDQVFHLVLGVVMAGLAWAAHAAVSLVLARRTAR